MYTLLKKIKGADVFGFDYTIIIPEQDKTNHFLLISSFSLNTKISKQTKQFVFHLWAIPLKAIFSICHTGFSENRRCHCFISSSSFIRSDKNMNKRLGKNDLLNKRTWKIDFLIFSLKWLISISKETNKKTIESFCLVRM